MIYLDNAATTYPKPDNVYLEMDRVNRQLAVNAGRGSYKLAREANKIISDTKGLIRKLVFADAGTAVVFSPSITIALNQIICGIAFNDNDAIYVTPFEHNAVARTLYMVSNLKKLKIKELPLDENLEIDLEKTRYEFIKDRPRAVFATHISNVTGYILPVKELFEISKQYGAINVLDTAQSMGLLEINARMLKADIIAFAGHKSLYGPFGIGGFINVTDIPLNEVIVGGTGSNSLNLSMPQGKESKYEAASSNIVAIAGLKAALEVINQKNIYNHEKELTEYLIKKLEKIPEIKVYKSSNQIGVVSFTMDGYLSEDIGTILDEDFDIAVRTGYHCAPYIHKYLKDENSLGTVRVGLGQFNTTKDIDNLLSALIEMRE